MHNKKIFQLIESFIDMMRLIAIVCLLLFCNLPGSASENMIPKSNVFEDDISWINSNLSFKFNPDVDLSTVEMIKRAGYPVESHVVTTTDGYILTLHRIPGDNSSLPVLLNHAFLCTSADWVILGKNKALAYLLADQGYDVWLGNFRGNTYSRAHISLSPSQKEFWDFSFHEMGIYDLPAMITYITNMRSQPLHTYIGHSMGTTTFYIMASELPMIAQNVRMMISFAPAAFISHMTSPVKYLVSFGTVYKWFMGHFFHDEFIPQRGFWRFVSKYVCEENFIQWWVCAKLMFKITGYDKEQFDYSLVPVILSHAPAGSSTKTLLHYFQMYKSDRFRQYDYGLQNLFKYHSIAPPNYDLTNIKVPIALFYSSDDLLINPVVEMIKRAGYPVESHVVTTTDGYILTLHRIPGNNGSLPVLLNHAFLCTSADWVMLGQNKALAYLLADQGYDVWLGNFRGNTYSRAHISLSPSYKKFWDFSFHEMGIYDLPAMITYITNMRSQPLHTYIGHSMGTTTFYIMASELPMIAQKVKIMISFAPAAFIGQMTSPLIHLTSFGTMYKFMRHFLHDEFMTQRDFWKFVSKYGCRWNVFQWRVCPKLMFKIIGYDEEWFDYTLLPIILNYNPAGSSAKTLLHYIQIYKSNRFCQYDYGHAENLFKYHTILPPNYNLTNIKVPIALFYGLGDLLINPEDVSKLKRALPNVVAMYRIPRLKFGHMDFVWSDNAPIFVYERVFNIMRKQNF
ncbi:lysosomal acid lipase/cholesteryl ester hydrolase-like [Anoplolepis gracilipes]|uniref:lysosomal acid lipase/cholesteryl ester hydrolase-like n=1 Tax=Anoplolepis gracilipes TaxID=354296 RepID=UPI003B9F2514